MAHASDLHRLVNWLGDCKTCDEAGHGDAVASHVEDAAAAQIGCVLASRSIERFGITEACLQKTDIAD